MQSHCDARWSRTMCGTSQECQGCLSRTGHETRRSAERQGVRQTYHGSPERRLHCLIPWALCAALALQSSTYCPGSISPRPLVPLFDIAFVVLCGAVDAWNILVGREIDDLEGAKGLLSVERVLVARLRL